jgi:hypothetical protein
MCLFTGSVHDVSHTAIFARSSEGNRQILVYSMALSASTDVALVLPLPIPPGSGEDVVRLIDLSAYPRFFDDLNEAIFSGSFGSAPDLMVHEVGAFEASFVPTRDDFARLDERFRIPDVCGRRWQATTTGDLRSSN